MEFHPDDVFPMGFDVADELLAWLLLLGAGFLNDHSKIRVRLLSRNTNDRFDEGFWRRRLRYALDYRKTVMGPDYGCCRLIFGEADQFPGLTVDRFGDILVTEVLSLGMEVRKDLLYPLLVELLREDGVAVRAIYERSDAPLRDKEGLPRLTGFYPLPGLATDLDGHLLLEENGIRYDVDYIHGQKTGFFLDQKYNRRAAAQIARGKRVLDCFTHTGSFALNAALGGAAHVTAVDVSQAAVDLARANAVRNGLEDRMDFLCADVFDLLPTLEGKGGYDFIILDPPAFTKSRKTTDNAMRGYKEINYRAMKLLPRGVFLRCGRERTSQSAGSWTRVQRTDRTAKGYKSLRRDWQICLDGRSGPRCRSRKRRRRRMPETAIVTIQYEGKEQD